MDGNFIKGGGFTVGRVDHSTIAGCSFSPLAALPRFQRQSLSAVRTRWVQDQHAALRKPFITGILALRMRDDLYGTAVRVHGNDFLLRFSLPRFPVGGVDEKERRVGGLTKLHVWNDGFSAYINALCWIQVGGGGIYIRRMARLT